MSVWLGLSAAYGISRGLTDDRNVLPAILVPVTAGLLVGVRTCGRIHLANHVSSKTRDLPISLPLAWVGGALATGAALCGGRLIGTTLQPLVADRSKY